MMRIKKYYRGDFGDHGTEINEILDQIDRLPPNKWKRLNKLIMLVALLKPFTQKELWMLVGYQPPEPVKFDTDIDLSDLNITE